MCNTLLCIVCCRLQVLKRNCTDPSVTFEILSNPEFLAEGTAIEGEELRGATARAVTQPEVYLLVLLAHHSSCMAA